MGVVCSRVCVAKYRSGSQQGRRNHVPATSHWHKHFKVEIECYCVPTNRLLPRDKYITGLAEGCRSVVVTTINIERLTVGTSQHKVSRLNSIVYTPVLQWFGIDVRHQVPQYLPMNLWPGSHTVFGFYKPEEESGAYVTLTAKIGNEDLYIEENMDIKRSLTAEHWSYLSRCLEKELAKLPTGTLTERGGMADDKGVEEELVQRTSQDTGYTSRRLTPGNQSQYSARNDQTSDSDEAGYREQQLREKRMRMKRKDTPSFSTIPFKSFHSKNRMRESPLTEEADIPNSSATASPVITQRSLSSTDLDKVTNVKTQVDANTNMLLTLTTLKASKSYQDISDIPPSPDQQNDSPIQEPIRLPVIHRKKKRSIACKIADDKTNAMSPANIDDKKYDHINIGSEADDERDSTYTGSDKHTKQRRLPEDDLTEDEASIISRCDPADTSAVSVKHYLDKEKGQGDDVKDSYPAADRQYLVKERDRVVNIKDISTVSDGQYLIKEKVRGDDDEDALTAHEKQYLDKENVRLDDVNETDNAEKIMQSKDESIITDETKAKSPRIVQAPSNIGINDTELLNEDQTEDNDQIDAVNIERKSAEILELLARNDSIFDSETVQQTHHNVRRKSKERAETPISGKRHTSSSSSRSIQRSISKQSYKEISESEEDEFRRKYDSVSYASRSFYSQTHSKRNKGYVDEPITPPLRKREAFSDTN